MFVIGLSGNFGTGKTTVSKMLVELGAEVINADEIGHWILKNNPQVYTELLNVFGDVILDMGGEIDRRRLGEKAFKSTEGAARLNRIMHPRVRQIIQEKIEEYSKGGIKVVVLEAALLAKSRWVPLVKEIWVATAPQELIISRLKSQRGYDESEVLDRLQRQMSPKEMLEQADVVIDTNCTLEELKIKVTELWQKLMSRL